MQKPFEHDVIVINNNRIGWTDDLFVTGQPAGAGEGGSHARQVGSHQGIIVACVDVCVSERMILSSCRTGGDLLKN